MTWTHLAVIGCVALLLYLVYVVTSILDVARGWLPKSLVKSDRFSTKNDVGHECVNRLTVSGDRMELMSFRRAATGRFEDHAVPLSFESLSRTPFDTRNPLLDTWVWDWRLHNWGVKLDVVRAWDTTNATITTTRSKLIYDFTTDKVPPVAILLNVSRQFPQLKFVLEYDYIRFDARDSRPHGRGTFHDGILSDEYLLAVYFNTPHLSVEEILTNERGVRRVGILGNYFRIDDIRPLGTLTYREASYYFKKFCDLMQEGIGLRSSSARLPTSVVRMVEALKVEFLNWCDQGQDFEESSQFMLQGIVRLASLPPDNLIAGALTDSGREASRHRNDMAATATVATAPEFWQQRINSFCADWIDFTEQYRHKYA